MQLKLKYAFLLIILMALSGCFGWNRPEVTRVEVLKGERVMRLYHGSDVLKTYKIDLGFGAVGDKQFEGDGKTPEGRYTINRRNPYSSYYRSLGISYPNASDIARARAQGKDPGSDIFIHGEPNVVAIPGPDWTAGCIAVNNRAMRQMYAMIKDGTVIDIYP